MINKRCFVCKDVEKVIVSKGYRLFTVNKKVFVCFKCMSDLNELSTYIKMTSYDFARMKAQGDN